jgi:hypothetical protein
VVRGDNVDDDADDEEYNNLRMKNANVVRGDDVEY